MGLVAVLVSMYILEGLVITLTFMLFEMQCPVVVIQVPLGLMTPLYVGTDLALQVMVLTVRVLLMVQILLMLVRVVVVRAQVERDLLCRGGAITIICGMLVIPVGTALTSMAEGHRVWLLGMQMVVEVIGAIRMFSSALLGCAAN